MFSRLSIFTVAAVMLYALHYFHEWDSGIISGGDGWGYYMYLPALFIHDDLATLETSTKVRRSYHSGYGGGDEANPLGIGEAHHIGNGIQVNKYTCGIAILQAPFFLAAHLYAKWSGHPADGYSLPYIYAAHLAALVYVFLALLLLRAVLRQYVGDKVVAATLVSVALGTNLYYFAVYNSPMSHAYLFALYAVLIFCTQRWYDRLDWRYAVGVGLTAGMITMIRPVEIICLIIPVFWGVSKLNDLIQRASFIRKHITAYALAVIAFATAGLPQLLYWKELTGKWLYYSYADEGFNFLDPHIIDGLFGFRNGWLPYTPIMILALIGIFLITGKGKESRLPIWLYLPLHIYIIYSWWNWYYINGFGSRPMVETYALLSIPLAFFYSWLFKKSLVWKVTIGTIAMVLIALNIFQTWQFSKGMMWTESSNSAYYWRMLGKSKMGYLDLVTYDIGDNQPDSNKLTFSHTILTNDFEDSTSVHYKRLNRSVKNNFVFELSPASEYSPGLEKSLAEAKIEGKGWVKISFDAMRKHYGVNLYNTPVMAVHIVRDGRVRRWRQLRIVNKVANETNNLWGGTPDVWGRVYFWYKLPGDAKPDDILKVFGWNPSGNIVYLDNLQLDYYKN